jgi:hypothetical protein
MFVLICRARRLILILAVLVVYAGAQTVSHLSFATPENAATALLQALKTDDHAKLRSIFGPAFEQTFSSGDPTADRQNRKVVALAMQQRWRWTPKNQSTKVLTVGDEDWPFPVPLTKEGSAWRFDTESGKDEVLARRIGANELTVIRLCEAYVLMQHQYADQEHDGKPKGLYAQKFRSSPGRQDGLYWSVKPGQRPSPLGDLAAEAAAEGYRGKEPSTPFEGYFFRVLTAQGKSAQGGAKNYVVDGDMSGGFALIAYPAKYGYSGVMTFIVNQSGVIYEKDLGAATSDLAGKIGEFNPDTSWARTPIP